jgi:hypothetical protein
MKRQLIFEEKVATKVTTYVPPNISLEKLRRAIPTHCFSRPLWKSFGYLGYNVSLILILGFLYGKFVGVQGTTTYAHFALNCLYSFVQGLFFTVHLTRFCMRMHTLPTNLRSLC